jgi:hypothetical protein
MGALIGVRVKVELVYCSPLVARRCARREMVQQVKWEVKGYRHRLAPQQIRR